MKIFIQIGIIFFICWIAQIIEAILPFAFPASVIGMLLVFLLLLCRVLKVEYIREKADFLLGNMAFFFLPAGVSIVNYFDVLKSCALQLIVICVVYVRFSMEKILRMPMMIISRVYGLLWKFLKIIKDDKERKNMDFPKFISRKALNVMEKDN